MILSPSSPQTNTYMLVVQHSHKYNHHSSPTGRKIYLVPPHATASNLPGMRSDLPPASRGDFHPNVTITNSNPHQGVTLVDKPGIPGSNPGVDVDSPYLKRRSTVC
eukprot:26068-Amorphochlora_amoeboformis.AAC.1